MPTAEEQKTGVKDFDEMFDEVTYGGDTESGEQVPEDEDNTTEVSPVSDSKKDPKKVVVEEKIEVPWAQSLALSPDVGVRFKEFKNQEYAFQPVFLDGERTKYFNVFCKVGDRDWTVLTSGLLSENYDIVQLDKYFEGLKKQVDFKDDEIIIHGNEPFVLSLSGKTTIKDLDVFDSGSEKDIFSLVTGADKDDLESLGTEVSIQCTNTYDGTRSLWLDHILNLSLKSKDKTFRFNDYFTLQHISRRIKHRGKIGKESALENIKETLSTRITKLRSITEVDEIQEKIAEKLPKDLKKKFNGLWGGAVGDFNNLYHMLILLSVVLSEDYSVRRHINLSGTVHRLIDPLVNPKKEKK